MHDDYTEHCQVVILSWCWMTKNIFCYIMNQYLLLVVFIHLIQVQHHQKSNSKRTQKFEPKILVWIAISENGISTTFFSNQQQELLLTQITYFNGRIKARLMPFIKKYHDKEKVLLWPDLAGSHYSLKVTEYWVGRKWYSFCISTCSGLFISLGTWFILEVC